MQGAEGLVGRSTTYSRGRCWALLEAWLLGFHTIVAKHMVSSYITSLLRDRGMVKLDLDLVLGNLLLGA